MKTLPDLLHQLLKRLAPEVVDQVEFVGIHSFARKVLQQRGVTFRIDPKQADQAFDVAWARVGVGSNLDSGKKDENYWKEEIASVLKGRGIMQFSQYADLTRTGRRFPLKPAQRETVWRLYVAYSEELRRRGVNDFADLILLAEAELRREPLPDHSAVIVDEAQDLSAAMVRMLYSLVGDSPDGFTLIGDGQQSIYPGGYTLAEVGISVQNRGVVLDVNYRNTVEIVDFARRLVDGDEYADIEGSLARGDVPSSVPRSGPKPEIFRGSTWASINAAMVERIKSVTREIGTGTGDVAVLCATKRRATNAAAALTAAGLPTISLEDYTGAAVDAIKVGTIKRAKGLEFKQVLIPDVSVEQTSSTPPTDDAEHERWGLSRRELYVAMTRARDGLWVGVVSSPSEAHALPSSHASTTFPRR